ncbi:MAG: O-methyltransferase [Lachnospiraceae bacterium]|nr:O-methyltransferase [Lachnospiraceae bacterium]
MWPIDEKRFSVFAETLRKPLPAELSDLYQDARKRGIPVIDEETMDILSFLLSCKKPERLLEIGSAIGFSASFIIHYLEPSATFTSIEYNDDMANEAEANWQKLGISERIRFIRGDAVSKIKDETGPYDFIFLDSAKGQYPLMLPDLKRLLEKGGILFSDNVSMEGRVMESRFFVERRDRTIHERIRSFLWEVSRDPDFQTDLLPLGDGILLALKLV